MAVNTSERTTPAPELPEILRALAAGETDALGALFDLKAPIVHAFALQVLGNRHLAREAVERTFKSIWQNAGAAHRHHGSADLFLFHLARVEISGLKESQSGGDRGDAVGLEMVDPISSGTASIELLQTLNALRMSADAGSEMILKSVFLGASREELLGVGGLSGADLDRNLRAFAEGYGASEDQSGAALVSDNAAASLATALWPETEPTASRIGNGDLLWELRLASLAQLIAPVETDPALRQAVLDAMAGVPQQAAAVPPHDPEDALHTPRKPTRAGLFLAVASVAAIIVFLAVSQMVDRIGPADAGSQSPTGPSAAEAGQPQGDSDD